MHQKMEAQCTFRRWATSQCHHPLTPPVKLLQMVNSDYGRRAYEIKSEPYVLKTSRPRRPPIKENIAEHRQTTYFVVQQPGSREHNEGGAEVIFARRYEILARHFQKALTALTRHHYSSRRLHSRRYLALA